MKILVFGNVGSGKTTVVNKLKDEYTFEVISIDDYRRTFGDGSEEREVIARNKFYNAIIEKKNQIIECIGIGEVADNLYELIHEFNEPIICLILQTSKEICLSRLLIRNWDVPFPHPKKKVYSLIERVHSQIEVFEMQLKWEKVMNIILVSRSNSNKSDFDILLLEMKSIIKQFN